MSISLQNKLKWLMRFSLLLALTACASLHAAERGTLVLHFLQLPDGEETWELSENVLHAHFEYTERGSTVPMSATLRVAADLTPIEFEAHGRSYRPFSVDASFRAGPDERKPFFAISGYAPFSVQMMMLRYWLAHGKPPRMIQRPGGDDLLIEETGHDAGLTRYSIANVVWGRESVWLNDRQEIAAAVSYAGNLPIEAVRPEYRDMLPKLIASATADRVKELANLPVKPLMAGAFVITGARLIDG